MKISSLNVGITSIVQVETLNDTSEQLSKGDEVQIHFPHGRHEPLLEAAKATFHCRSIDDKTKAVMANLCRRQSARLCWVVNTKHVKNRTQVTIQIHVFEKQIIQNELLFSVDERIQKRLAERTSQSLEKTCQYLQEHVILPPFKEGEPCRFIATIASGENNKFTIIGDSFELDIEESKDKAKESKLRLMVARKAPKRKTASEKRHLVLITSKVKFTDGTIATGHAQSIRSRLEDILQKADSYLGVWDECNKIERIKLREKAEKVGWVRYTSFQRLPDGRLKFSSDDENFFIDFYQNIQLTDTPDLGVSENLPVDLSEAKQPEDGARIKEDYQIGEIENIDRNSQEVTLKFQDPTKKISKQGYLFAAQKKDQVQLKRREDAYKRIKSADSRMPQLALILENAPFPVGRIDREPPLSASSQKAFGVDDEPTPEQRLAIDCAINTPDIVLIQGPPGTGKTKVIAAINARLAEIESGDATGRTLLTSFQHTAVDNVAVKTSVNGLPTIRLGGSKQGSDLDMSIDIWRKKAEEEVKSVLSTIQSQRPQSTYKNLRNRVTSYAANTESKSYGRNLLEEVQASQSEKISPGLLDEIRKFLRGSLAIDQLSDVDVETQMREQAVRNIRTRQESFMDDGPKMARRARKILQEVLTPEESDLLDEAANVRPSNDFERRAELEVLKTALLNRLCSEPVDAGPLNCEPDVQELLYKVLNELKDIESVGRDGEADALDQYVQALHNDPKGVESLLHEYGVTHAATCQQSVSKSVQNIKDSLEYENVIIEEAAHANPLDLFVPMALAKRRIILVGDHRQLPHLLAPEVEQSIMEGIDQSKTTDSVREQVQENLKKSLFEQLFTNLQSSKDTSIRRVVTLRDQYRMHPILGKFVSDNFYAPYGEEFRSPRPPDEFKHDLKNYHKSGLPICAAWKDIPLSAGKEVSGKSKSRPAEAKWIAKELKQILTTEDSGFSIGVITFYEAQRKEIWEQLVHEEIAYRDEAGGGFQLGAKYRSFTADNGQERLRIGTVDSFQGKEFDVVFLSTTRSNDLPSRTETQRRKKYGHLLLENRICVAMSRQQKLLVAVGDMKMFQANESREHLPGLACFLELCGGSDGIIL